MSNWAAQIQGLALVLALAGIGPASALAAEPAKLPAMEKAWHSCVRQAYDRQPERGIRFGRAQGRCEDCGRPHGRTSTTLAMATGGTLTPPRVARDGAGGSGSGQEGSTH